MPCQKVHKSLVYLRKKAGCEGGNQKPLSVPRHWMQHALRQISANLNRLDWLLWLHFAFHFYFWQYVNIL